MRACPRLALLLMLPASIVGTSFLREARLAAEESTFAIDALSTDSARVTGGDVLLGIRLPASVSPQSVRVMADARDVTSIFRPSPFKALPHQLVGVLTGLPVGRTNLSVSRVSSGRPDASLTITNYPATGPVFSGPHLTPFICQTEAFVLPDGSKLGPASDANCSARTVVQYVYRSTQAKAVEPAERGAMPAVFKPLPSLTTLPADVAKTTTATGATVNFVVRVETGTMNRGIYQNVILHDPTSEPAPTPFSPPRAWNGRLIGVHGVGCPSGWYIQGAAMGITPFDETRLGEGYALFVNTLNHPTNSCNAVLAAETTMMGKEHFIETFGVPLYTFSTGSSGGAYTSLQIADAYPGIFDGVSIGNTFPDALSIALAGLDAHLLTHYFGAINPRGFTDTQKLAITGYQSIQALVDAANQAQRTDPVPDRADIEGYASARWNAAVPAALRYHPKTNPTGSRPTVFDVARNIYGVNPQTGAARRPFDNVGVQYGLSALNTGAITVKQFLDLNEGLGGFDDDANYVPARTVGDAGAIKRAYQSGLLLGGSGALSSIPIFDNATSNETRGYHYGWFHFALRERIAQANKGNSDNMVMWRTISAPAAKQVFDDWMIAAQRNESEEPPRARTIRARPPSATEGCFDTSTPPQFVAEPLVFTTKPSSRCSSLYPVYSNIRREAGGPLAANILKCQLKSVDRRDYTVGLSQQEWARLKTIFPNGVCDWTKSGVNQVPVVTWASFGPSPKNLVFDVTKP